MHPLVPGKNWGHWKNLGERADESFKESDR